jgi:uncharacterized protein YndB with AHSA1/START domain/DNA-binding transcriptional ArsR family regulator
MDEELVFKAMADASRRKLLDLLFEHNGQTLSQLQAHLPMTRFGCMKHLQILEDAGLITTQKVGREKYHYLNPVPIQLVYDRWVSKYAQSWSQTLAGLKNRLEEKGMSQKPSHVFQIFIRTTSEQLWQALTDSALTQQYFFDSRVESTWTPGAPYRLYNPNGEMTAEGEVLEIDPPRRLVTTFRPLWRPDEEGNLHSKVTWEIEPMGAVCKLTLIHEDFDPESALMQRMKEGWARSLSSLKTLLETGEPLLVAE